MYFAVIGIALFGGERACHYARNHSQDSQRSNLGGGVTTTRYDEVFVIDDGGVDRSSSLSCSSFCIPINGKNQPS
ncbi:hypothetical protein GYH30_035422 [Glycine max]|nr:hypothetical protein GYH30_035422 [Glycine max]